MGIPVGSQFDVQTGLPLDSRTTVATLTARDAIAALIRYEGLIVYCVATGLNYQLVGGIANANWAVLSSGGGGGGATTTGPFTVNDNSSSALSGETTASGSYTQVDHVARVIRGTSVFARIAFSIFYRNGAWELVLGEERNSGTPSGVSFTVNTSTGQITAAADTGAGNATITLQKISWGI